MPPLTGITQIDTLIIRRGPPTPPIAIAGGYSDEIEDLGNRIASLNKADKPVQSKVAP